MVKPLNQEWQLFGRRYRVEGAKGDKVNCNACQKQVSAAVNRLQSHLRNCPARASLPAPFNLPVAKKEATTGQNDRLEASTEPHGGVVGADEVTSASQQEAVQPVKRQRLYSPGNEATMPKTQVRATAASSSIDELLTGLSPSVSLAAHSSTYTKRRLEIEERRLELELRRDQREEQREQLEMEILETKARREKVELKNAEADARMQRIRVEKEAYESKVMLALSRKQLLDQGVAQDEIDRILPISTAEESVETAATLRSHPGAAYSIVSRHHHAATDC